MGLFRDAVASIAGRAIKPSSVETGELNGGVTGSIAVGKIFGERIASKTPSSQSAVEFTSGINSDYDRYVIYCNDLSPATDGVSLTVEVSTDGGSNWKTGASAYEYAYEYVASDGLNSTVNSAGSANIQIATFIANDRPYMGRIEFARPADGTHEPHFDYSGCWEDGGNNIRRANGSGKYLTAEAIDAVRLKFSSDNISNGEVDLYGVMS